ncbi:MAG TPA: transglutaminase family protein [Chitinophagaceae bacterium]|nr:transglutaminase family protein [Chitinophagaceae bacterium]
MQQTKEINALFTLIDDPDHEVYSTVSEKIVEFGKGIIPNLEDLWENTLSEDVQERIEMLIHRLHYTDLTNDLIEWKNSSYHDLLFGALLIAKFQYPDLHTTPVLQDIEKIRRNVWLELNSYLTPLEQANVLSSIMYNYYQLKGAEVNYTNHDEFFINKVLETKNGNAISNGIIYQVMCELLDINAKIINIPKQMIIAFYQTDFDAETYKGNPQEKIHFYVDGVNGQAYSHKDIENYFKRINVPPVASYYKPLSHKRIIQVLAEEVAKCFDLPSNEYKQNELKQLANLLD